MVEIFSHMLWPLLACFILVGIHAYLGIHIIARKVIFVDLALAQIAGLGAVYAVFIGLSLESNALLIKAVSVGFTLLGALLFAFTQKHDEKVPHEAVIGIIYAGALSMTVLFTANLPHGADEVQQMLAGNILWVTPREVMITAACYAGIGAIHIFCRKPFFALSHAIALGQNLSLKQRLWDFLFYATFGVVVTSSVGIGGVLLVFGYLVIPSVMAVMLADSTKARLLIAWLSGLVVSTAGVVLSYYLDLPSGPTIVVLMAALLVLLSMLSALYRSPINALFQLSLIVVLLLFVAVPLLWMHWGDFKDKSDARRHQQSHRAAHEGELDAPIKELLLSKDIRNNMEALQEIKEHRLVSLLPLVEPFIRHSDSKMRELSVHLMAHLGYSASLPGLKEAFELEDDQFIKIDIADTIALLGDKQGLTMLARIAMNSDSPLAREDGVLHLQALLLEAPKEQNLVLKWLNQHEKALRFDPELKKYKLSV